MEVLDPKGPNPSARGDLPGWARDQVVVAGQILDNPGGGLLFATQTIGQVRAALEGAGSDRYGPAVRQLELAEEAAVRRDYNAARERLEEARRSLA